VSWFHPKEATPLVYCPSNAHILNTIVNYTPLPPKKERQETATPPKLMINNPLKSRREERHAIGKVKGRKLTGIKELTSAAKLRGASL